MASRSEQLRQLPSVERLLADPATEAATSQWGRPIVVDAVRRAVAEERARLQGTPPVAVRGVAELARRASDLARPHQRKVLNASGVVLHTNLGRAPLARPVIDALQGLAGGYENLESDLAEGGRGRRGAGVEQLLCALTGADAATVVNNNAAALVLAVAALGTGREVVVSRGQLIEIGGSFRLPEIIEAAGARLVEVGTTNCTRPEDYARAITDATAMLLLVHPSNFEVVGFTRATTINQLVRVGHAHGVAVLHDIGSGLLRPEPRLPGEPDAQTSLGAGSTLTVFSADKLLGGPQAGVVVGSEDAVERCKGHPLARALRASRLTLGALEGTLRLHMDPDLARLAVPVLRMLHESSAAVARRAAQLADALGGDVVQVEARLGGGAAPGHRLPSAACALPDVPVDRVARLLRLQHPALVARVADGRVLLDARTLQLDEVDPAISSVLNMRRETVG